MALGNPIMEEWLVSKLGSWVIIILLCGAIADFLQFAWLLKRASQRFKRRMYLRIKENMESAYVKEMIKQKRGTDGD